MRTVVNSASSQQAGSAALAKSKPAALLPRNARGTVVVPAPAVAGPSRPSTAVAALADGKDAEQSHASRKRVVVRVAMDPAAEEVKSVAWSVVMHTSRSLAENIFTSAGLAMTVIAEDGTKIVSNESLFGFTKERWQDPKELAGTKFLGKVNLPAGVRPAAVELSRTFGPKMLIESLHFKSSDTGLDIFFTCEGYLTKGTPRVFFGSTALPNQTPVGIRDLRRQELLDLKGVGNPDLHALRKADDRIYDYAVYNDLGNVEKGNVRVPLGGTPDYPYPRRMATNRDTVLYNDGNKYEVLPSGLLGKPWVPHDDAFDPDKSAGFVGNAIVSFLPAIQLLDFPPKKEFKNMQDYLSLFDNDEGQLEPALPRSGESAFMLLFQAQKAIAVTASKIKQAVAGRSLVDGIVDLFAPYNDIGDIFQYPAPYNVANPRRGHMSEAQFREVQQELDVDSKVTDTSRVDVWRTDEEFGRQFVAGINPMVLVAMGAASGKGLPANTKITAADLQPFLAEGETVEGLMAADKPRLFYIDYYAVIADALDDIQRANPQSNRAQHAGHCILYRRPDGHLVPIAIDLTSDAHNPKAGLQVFTPADKGAVWPIAKAIFMSIDSGYHQLISHWLRTHACQEPYLIATRRCLSSMHPVYKLIMPHFRYTAQINANARASLINAGGTIEKCFTPGSTAMALSSKVYGAIWNFATEALPADLKLRGFLDESGKLNVEDYPYAEDGLLIWNAIEGYFKEYINLYYKNDAEVLADEEIQDWWTDIRTKGHGDKANAEGCWPELTTRANLVYVLATIAWMGSAHHAAVNFGQYDYAAFMPAHSSMIRKPMPKRNSNEFKVLAKSIGDTADYHLLSFMATPSEATRVTTVVKLLTVHARDEQYLSDTDQEWITDPAAMKLHAKFVEEIKEADHIISGRNMHPTGTARSLAANGLPYRYMIPSSAPGSTGQGVPYSISI